MLRPGATADLPLSYATVRENCLRGVKTRRHRVSAGTRHTLQWAVR